MPAYLTPLYVLLTSFSSSRRDGHGLNKQKDIHYYKSGYCELLLVFYQCLNVKVFVQPFNTHLVSVLHCLVSKHVNAPVQFILYPSSQLTFATLLYLLLVNI